MKQTTEIDKIYLWAKDYDNIKDSKVWKLKLTLRRGNGVTAAFQKPTSQKEKTTGKRKFVDLVRLLFYFLIVVTQRH